jgi:hypothetical protein
MNPALQALHTQHLRRPILRARRNAWLDMFGKGVILLPIMGGLLHLHEPQANQFVGLLAGFIVGMGYFYYRLLRGLGMLFRVVGNPAELASQPLANIRMLLSIYYLAHAALILIGVVGVGLAVAHRQQIAWGSGASMLELTLLAVSTLMLDWLLRRYMRRTFNQHLKRLRTLLASSAAA